MWKSPSSSLCVCHKKFASFIAALMKSKLEQQGKGVDSLHYCNANFSEAPTKSRGYVQLPWESFELLLIMRMVVELRGNYRGNDQQR